MQQHETKDSQAGYYGVFRGTEDNGMRKERSTIWSNKDQRIVQE